MSAVCGTVLRLRNADGFLAAPRTASSRECLDALRPWRHPCKDLYRKRPALACRGRRIQRFCASGPLGTDVCLRVAFFHLAAAAGRQGDPCHVGREVLVELIRCGAAALLGAALVVAALSDLAWRIIPNGCVASVALSWLLVCGSGEKVAERLAEGVAGALAALLLMLAAARLGVALGRGAGSAGETSSSWRPRRFGPGPSGGLRWWGPPARWGSAPTGWRGWSGGPSARMPRLRAASRLAPP